MIAHAKNTKKIDSKAISLFILLCLASNGAVSLHAQAESNEQESSQESSLDASPEETQESSQECSQEDSLPELLPLLSRTAIRKAHKKAKQTVMNHERATKALIVLALGQQGFGLYTLIMDITEPRAPKVKAPDNGEPEPGLFEIIGNGLSNLADPSTWPTRCLGLGKAVATIFGHLMISNQIQKLIDKVDHDDTIFWFKDKQTSYNEATADAQSYAEKLNESDITPERAELHKKMLLLALGDTIHQIEKIVGYMHYKTTVLERSHHEAYQEVSSALTREVVTITNEFVTIVNTRLTHRQTDQDYATLVDSFTTKMDSLLDDFARLDPDAQVYRAQDLTTKNRQLAKLGRAILKLPPEMLNKVRSLLVESKADGSRLTA